MTEKSSFALVIPCYNEEKVIPTFSGELRLFISEFKQKYPSFDLKVIIVDNNSTDQSVALLKNMTEIHLVSCAQQGYGAALKCGFLSEKADYYAFSDLDNTYPLIDLTRMLQMMLTEPSVQMVSGGRLNRTSQIPLTRRLGNLFYSVITRALFLNCSIRDTCSGLRVFKESLLSQVVALKENDLSFSIELTAHALKNKWILKEHPIYYRERIGFSKLGVIKDEFKFLYVLLKKKLTNAQ